MTTEPKEPWSVWFANVRFDDGSGSKDRPVIVLNDNVVLCICMPVTSKDKSRYRDHYRLQNIASAKLTKESWVKFEFIELRQEDFRRKLGELDKNDISNIQAWIGSSEYERYAHD